MTIAVYISIYAGLLIFLAGCLLRILEYAHTPFHLRWELYPVAHEEPRFLQHGGSYFESGEWWLSPQSVDHRSEWTTMAREIFLLKGLWEFNRRLWPPSFLFHFGLYLSIASVSLAAVAALVGAHSGWLWIGIAGGWIGLVAIVMVLTGALWLLARRIADPGLKNYTKASDIFNLALFIAASAFLAVGFLAPGAQPASIVEIAHGAFRFDQSAHISVAAGIGLMLCSALVAYIPYTHMAHFIAKYFTWHSVRWDDRRNDAGSRVERKVAASLAYRPTWAAAHMGADGKKSWAEIATSNPAEEVRK